MNEIIININEANRVQKYEDVKNIFQIDAFEKVSKILQEHQIGKNTNDITECRFHDTIFIEGDRGTGKTAFMINIENYYNKYFKAEEKPKYIFLKPVDPTLLEHTEKFLSVVLARIVEYVNDNKENIEKGFDEKYYKALEDLSKSLEAIKTLDKDIGIEEIASNKSSLKLEQHAHKFFQVVCNMFDVNAIVMLIDDVDMAFDKGFDVLEVVRKYLASPYIIPIVAGDMKLYVEIVETRFKEKIQFFQDVKYFKDLNNDLKSSDEYKEKMKLLNHLVEQYLRKVFHTEYRIELKNIFKIIKENLVTVRFADLDVPFIEIRDFEIRYINFGINQKRFIFEIVTDNTRNLIQYLIAKKDIYINFFKNIEYSKDTKYESYLPQKVMIKYDKSIVAFMKTPNYKKSLEITYHILKDDKNSILSKFLSNDLNTKYLISYELEKLLQVKEKESPWFVIQYKNLETVLKEGSKYSDIEDYIINLFIHNDYINQHQTKNYIYAGKFVELVIYSLFIQEKIEFDFDYIKKISEKIKLVNFDYLLKNQDYDISSAIFDKNSEDLENGSSLVEISNYFNELEINKDLLELSSIVNGEPFNSSKIYDKTDTYDVQEEVVIDSKTTDLSRNLILWKNIFAKNLTFNSTTLYRILDKFYTNLNDMKSQKFVDSPLEFLQRIILIFINSIAYFENTNIKIANTNIAIGDRFDLTKALTKTNAATLNIKPLISEEKTLTKALFFHPIISHVLFPDDNSKLKKLEFVGQKTKNSDVNNEIKIVQKINENQLFEDLQSLSYGDDIIKCFEQASELFESDDYTQKQKYLAIKKMQYKTSRWRTLYGKLSDKDKEINYVIEIWNKINNAQK